MSVIDRKMVELFMMLGLLTDPFIYVFFVPHYRKVIIERVIAHNKWQWAFVSDIDSLLTKKNIKFDENQTDDRTFRTHYVYYNKDIFIS